jgi:hypothetical protein
MMSFTILTAISPSYASTLKRFIPTWAANSGAANIDVRILKGKGWSECIVERAGIIAEVVCESCDPVVWLDADIYVVKPFHGGLLNFRSDVAVARWPNINAGLLAFDPEARDWQPFFYGHHLARGVVDDIATRCKRNPDGSRGESDQKIWFEHLSKIEDQVHKLDSDEWNYTGLPENWATDLPRIKGTVRALHTRGNGVWPDDLHRLMHEHFPEEMACTESV